MWLFSGLLACEALLDRRQEQARAALQAGELDRAAELMAAVPFERRSPEGHLVIGSLLVEAGQPEDALAAFEVGLDSGQLPELAVNACVLRVALEREPLEACKRAVELAPEDANAFLYLGHASRSVGAESAAVEAWSRACELASEPSLDMGRACLHAGRARPAQQLLEALDEPEAHRLLLRLAVDEAASAPAGPGRALALERAHRWERQLLEDEDAAVLTDRGRLALLEGERLAAEAHWREALKRSPGLAAPRIDLARSLSQRGRTDEARSLLEDGAGLGDLEALAVLHELLGLHPDAERTALGWQACVGLGDEPCAAAFVTLLPQP